MRDINALHEAKYVWNEWVQRQCNNNNRLRLTIKTDTNQLDRVRKEIPVLEQRIVQLQGSILQAKTYLQEQKDVQNISDSIQSDCLMSEVHYDYLTLFHRAYEQRLVALHQMMEPLRVEQEELQNIQSKPPGPTDNGLPHVDTLEEDTHVDLHHRIQQEEERVFGILAPFKAAIKCVVHGCRFCTYNQPPSAHQDCNACRHKCRQLSPLDRVLLLLNRVGVSPKGQAYLQSQYTTNPQMLEDHLRVLKLEE
jgi:hypothetical protein